MLCSIVHQIQQEATQLGPLRQSGVESGTFCQQRPHKCSPSDLMTHKAAPAILFLTQRLRIIGAFECLDERSVNVSEWIEHGNPDFLLIAHPGGAFKVLGGVATHQRG